MSGGATKRRVRVRCQTQQGGKIKSLATACALYFFQIGDEGNVIAALYCVAGSVTLPRPVAKSACWVAGLQVRGVRTGLFLNGLTRRLTKTRAEIKMKK